MLTVEATTRRLFILFSGLCFGLISMSGVVAFLALTEPAPGPVPQLMTYELAGMSVAVMVTMLVLRRRMMPQRIEGDWIPWPSEHADQALQKLIVASIITWAMCESIGLFGVVLVLLTHDLRLFAFGGASLLVMAIFRPSAALVGAVARAASPP